MMLYSFQEIKELLLLESETCELTPTSIKDIENYLDVLTVHVEMKEPCKICETPKIFSGMTNPSYHTSLKLDFLLADVWLSTEPIHSQIELSQGDSAT